MFQVLLFVALFFCANSFMQTVDILEADKYVGHWYQVYGAPFDFTFQGYGKCITADYGILPNGNISVLNSQLTFSNELQQIGGYAYYDQKREPGKLVVHLDGTPKDAPYWVVSLGEVVDNQYQYSVITTPTELAMWVITRNVDTFREKYDEEVQMFLQANNFTYIEIEQDRCP